MDAAQEVVKIDIHCGVTKSEYAKGLFRPCHLSGARVENPTAEMRHMLRLAQTRFACAQILGHVVSQFQCASSGRGQGVIDTVQKEGCEQATT